MSQTDYSKLFDKFIELVSHNSIDFLEYIDDFKNMRETKQMLIENKEFARTFYQFSNKFFFDNGLYHRLNFQYLEDEELAFMSLFLNEHYQPKNRYLQQYLKYFFENLNCNMSELHTKFFDSEFIKNDYNKIPGIAAGLQKYDLEELKKSTNTTVNTYKPEFNVSDAINKAIKIGSCLQFNVDGFIKNQFLYLLYGLAISDCVNRFRTEGFKTFNDLVNNLINFIQLNLLSKCYDGRLFKDSFNLITFIDSKKEGKVSENYRYQIAKKYIQYDKIYWGNTVLKDDERGLYICTEYKDNELNELWLNFENLFKEKKYTELLNTWFNSQCLTRSTCLIGCMLIMIFTNKEIEFLKDEMPDWKSILQGSYEGTYIEKADIETAVSSKLCLKDVLHILKTYMTSVIERVK